MSEESPEDTIGVVVGEKGGCIVVKLDNGDEVECRGWKKLHRTYGCFVPHIGMKVRLRLAPIAKNKRPLLVDIVRDE